MVEIKAGSVVRFSYRHQDFDEHTGTRFKEVLVLNPNWKNCLHGIDMRRITPAQREVLVEVMDPSNKGRPHRIPLVTDILRRMDPAEEIKQPVAFYSKMVKPFLKGVDAYRVYIISRMVNTTIVKPSRVKGTVSNPKPLFHNETKNGPSPKGGVFKKV